MTSPTPSSLSQSVFLFVDNEVRPDAVTPYLEYVKSVVPTVSQFGGRYLCRQGAIHVVPSPSPSGAAAHATSGSGSDGGGAGGQRKDGDDGDGDGDVEGDDWWRFSTAVLIEFPSRDAAERWMHEKETMAPLHAARKTHAKSRMMVAEGLSGTWCEERDDCPGGSAYILVDNVVRDAEPYKVRSFWEGLYRGLAMGTITHNFLFLFAKKTKQTTKNN